MVIASTCLRMLIFGISYILTSIIFLDSFLIRRRKTIVPWIIIGILWAVKTILLEYLLEIFGGGWSCGLTFLKYFI